MKLVLGIDLDLAHFHKLLVHYVSYNHVVRNGVFLDKDQNSGCGGRNGWWSKHYVAVAVTRSGVNFLSSKKI